MHPTKMTSMASQKDNSLVDTRKFLPFLLIIGLTAFSLKPQAQGLSPRADSTQSLTLDQCIDYAFKHQPALFKSFINQSITKTTNAINLSGWYPQVNLGGNFTHYNSIADQLFY